MGAGLTFSTRTLSQIWKAFKQLNPENVRKEAERQVRVAIIGPTETIQDAAAYLLKDNIEAYDRAADVLILLPLPLDPDAGRLLKNCDLALKWSGYSTHLPEIATGRVFSFSTAGELENVIRDIVYDPELKYARLPLARALPAFRSEVAVSITQSVSVENAIFVVSTSLGNVIPNPLQVLSSVGEALGDLVVLTANQLRMLFMLAGAYDKEMGYKVLAPEMLSIVGSAFGWRALAREAVGMIPLGGGIVPKAAIAFAGTWAIGEGISYYYSTGKKLTNEQLKERFNTALTKGRANAESIYNKIKETAERLKTGGKV
ncbi:MAG: hypothetical protein ABFD54_14015 [Armatimonadota bacterium]|nr:hypothetical protein [bacterium]